MSHFSNDCPRTAPHADLQDFGGSDVQPLNIREPEQSRALNTPDLPRWCEALMINSNVGYGSGSRCEERAEFDFNGRGVCWVHWKTCTTGPRATGEAAPVEFRKSVARRAV
jgi:hypothetical protein